MTHFQIGVLVLGGFIACVVFVCLLALWTHLRRDEAFEQRLAQLADELDGVNERDATRTRAAQAPRHPIIKPPAVCPHKFGTGTNALGEKVCLGCGKTPDA